VESAGGCISVSPSYWSFASGRAPGTGHSIIVAAQRNQQTGKHAFFAVVLLLLLMQRATTTKANPDMMISTRREDKGMRKRERGFHPLPRSFQFFCFLPNNRFLPF
jgi:hypothetical protein